MSGHSKWSTIKRKKGKTDAQRGRVFTKLIREITIAAREGGGDAEANPRLRAAVAAARAANMPADNIKRAIMKGTGELEGTHYEQSSYEGYGPGGVAILVETLTDNKNRTVAEIRHVFTKHGGSLGEVGCVGWMFERKGFIVVDGGRTSEDEIMEKALEAGALDVKTSDDTYDVFTDYSDLDDVRASLEASGIKVNSAEQTKVPQNTIKLFGKDAEQMLKLYEALEDHDDVVDVFANFDIDESIMVQVSEQAGESEE